MLLTVRKSVEVREHRNRLVIDVNEDSVGCLLVDYDGGKGGSLLHQTRRRKGTR